jgi:hypothetical protein
MSAMRGWLLVSVLGLVGVGCKSGNECPACIEEKCSDLVDICKEDADCACMVDCMGDHGIGGVEACLGTCKLTQRPASFFQVEECTAVACPDSEDECSTPSDWTPPEDAVACDGTGSGSIGGGNLEDCGFDDALPFDPEGNTLQLESEDGSVCVRLKRRDDGAGSLANTNYTLLELQAGPKGEVARVDSDADLCWYSSHHNFRDWAHAWTGTRHFDLVLKEDGHSGARTYELYSFEQGPLDGAACAPTADGSTCIDGPIELFPVGT